MFRPHSGGKYPFMQRLIAATLLSSVLTVGAASAQTRPPQPVDSDFAYRQRVEERLSGVDYQMRGLTGQVEQLQFRLRQAETRIKKLVAELEKVKAEQAATPPAIVQVPKPDIQYAAQDGLPTGDAQVKYDETQGLLRVGRFEAATPPAIVQAPKPDIQYAAQDGLPTGDAQVKYDEAQGLLRVGRFEQAENAFVAFRKSFPDHSLAANAHYWTGEAQYARKRYQEAATTFLEAWKSDMQGLKAPDNLYKLGMSMRALEKKDEACASFAKLLSDYRGAPKRLRDKTVRGRASLKCS